VDAWLTNWLIEGRPQASINPITRTNPMSIDLL
jgi:hypothetical protein